jgi:hypothetical protein
MSGPEFWQTGMGRTYYERTLPALVAALGRLNDNLAKLLAVVGKDEPVQQEKSK